MKHTLWLEVHCSPHSPQVEPHLRTIAAVFPADKPAREGSYSYAETPRQPTASSELKSSSESSELKSSSESSELRSSSESSELKSSPAPCKPPQSSSIPQPGSRGVLGAPRSSAMSFPLLAPLSPLPPPVGDDGGDLTSLNWLHNLHLAPLSTPPTPPASPPAESARERKRKKAEVELPNINYKQCCVKPPYSYATLIIMAMEENKNKMTLASIYKWIKDNFVYYKTADPSWQNSIRHNLSLNKCFMKVPRSKAEPGKGGFWRLDPEYSNSIINGVFKKRRPPFLRPGYTKRVRSQRAPVLPTTVPLCQPRVEPMARATVWDPTIGQEVEVDSFCFTAEHQPLLAPATLSMIELSPESLAGGEELNEFSHSELSDASSESPDCLASTLDLSMYAGGEDGALPAAPLHASDLLSLDPVAPCHGPLHGYTPHWEISRALGMLDPSLDLDGLIDMEGMVTSI